LQLAAASCNGGESKENLRALCNGGSEAPPFLTRGEGSKLVGCGKTRCGTLCSAGILPASEESKGVAGWKPALPPLRQAAGLFRRAMGGLDRHGSVRTGSPEDVKKAASEVLKDAPARTFLVNKPSEP
jgi:hypothetical protein